MRRLLVFVVAVLFVDTALYAVIAPLLPAYAADLALSKAEAGTLVAAYPAGVLAGSLPAGWLASRAGPRITAVAGLSMLAAASVVFGFARELALLDGARFAQGVGSAASWTGALAWLARETSVARRGERLGIAFSAAVAGQLTGPAIGAVARETDPAIVFAAAAALSVVLVAGALRLPAPTATVRGPGWGRTLRERALLPGVAVILLVALFFGVVEVLVPLRFDELGAGGAVIGAAFAAAALGQAIVGPIVGRVADRIGSLRPVQVGLGFGVLAALALPLPETPLVLFGCFVAAGPLVGILFVPGMKLLSDGAERAALDQGYAFAVLNLAWAATLGGGAAGAGAIAAAISDEAAYATLAALLAAALVRTLAVRRVPAAGRASS